MTDPEYYELMSALSVGVGKPFMASPRPGMPNQVDVYRSLLIDLPQPALKIAVERCLLESNVGFLPTVGTLRKLALEALGGARPTAGQAWELVMAATNRFPWRQPQNSYTTPSEWIVANGLENVWTKGGPELRDRLRQLDDRAKKQLAESKGRFLGDNSAEAFASLPEDVARAARCIGWRALCNVINPETMFAQFRDVYKDLETRRERDALLPGTVRKQLEAVRAAGGQLADKSGRALGELVAIGAGETFGEAVR